MRASAFGLVLLLAPCLAACGGGGALLGDVYRDGEASYRIGQLPDGWESVGVRRNDLAWHHEGHGSIVQVNASCDPFSDVPLTSLTNHLLIGFTDREWRSQDIVPLDSRDALRSHVSARLDGVPRELLLYVLKKDECTYDFALVAPPGEGFESARAEFEPFVQGFSTEVP